MIIIDYSGVAIANVMSFRKDLDTETTAKDKEKAVNIIRHAILASIKNIRKKFGKQYGEMVLACDGKEYWRREVFPNYKSTRSTQRDASGLDWKLIFDTLSELANDIDQIFPYKVIKHRRAEGDDIIGVLTKHFASKANSSSLFEDDVEPILIVSRDGDFDQLLKYKNVKRLDPSNFKLVHVDNPEQRLLEKILQGDRGDAIPNVLSSDDVFVVEGTRQSKITAKVMERFVNGRDGCKNDVERRNWDRNNMLINLECIPSDLSQDIIELYNNANSVSKRMDIFNYLMKHNCRQLLDDVENF